MSHGRWDIGVLRTEGVEDRDIDFQHNSQGDKRVQVAIGAHLLEPAFTVVLWAHQSCGGGSEMAMRGGTKRRLLRGGQPVVFDLPHAELHREVALSRGATAFGGAVLHDAQGQAHRIVDAATVFGHQRGRTCTPGEGWGWGWGYGEGRW